MLSLSQMLRQIKEYKSKVEIKHTQLENFLDYLDQKVFKRVFCFCSPFKATMTPSFERAFLTLNEHERADYYLTCLKILHEINHNKPEDKQSGHERLEVQYRQERKLWKMSPVILSYKQNVLEVEAIGAKLKLEYYILRISKGKNKEAFVLESTRADCEPTTIRISHSSNEDYWKLILKVKKLVMGGLRGKIEKMYGIDRDSKEMDDNWFRKRICMSIELSKSFPEERKSLRRMLQATMHSDLSRQSEKGPEKVQKQLIDSEIIKNLDDYGNYQQIEPGFLIHSQKERIRIVCVFEPTACSLSWLVQQLQSEDHFRLWKNSLCSIFLIADVPQEKTKFYHQINIYKDGNEVDYVYLRNKFRKDGAVYFVDKSISTAEYGSHESCSSRGNIEYCVWRIKQTNVGNIEILVEAEINHIPCVDIYQAMREHIGELENILLCKNASKKQKKLQQSMNFYSIAEDSSFSSSQLLGDEIYEGAGIPVTSVKENDSISNSFISINGFESDSLILKSKPSAKEHRYQVCPYYPSERLIKEFKNGNFFDQNQCITNEIGDLVFINQQKTKFQAAVIVKLLKRMGTGLLGGGKNMQNVSFPIEILGTDTNMERLCKAMAYAPHFLQNKVTSTPLERMKASICFAIGNLLLYIDMAKPFNPILGETYQGFIDGCPVYGEQTSHHPSVSSLFLVGRDYFVSGNIESTVLLNMNSISGANQGEYKIAFHKSDPSKNVIIFTSPPGELSGIIYGERKLNIIESSRFYDPQNKLFCELRWGKTKCKGTVCRYHDYLQGKIVELSKRASNISKVKESQKDTVLGYITGRWTETIYFNDEAIFDINKVNPFIVVDQTEPLGSDSRFRPDKQLVEKKMFFEAQMAKDSLEQTQRNDRKLRMELAQ